MTSSSLEIFLARLYTDEVALQQFLIHPSEYASQAGLDNTEIAALSEMDFSGLKMAAASYAAKRKQHRQSRSPIYGPLLSWLKTLRRM